MTMPGSLAGLVPESDDWLGRKLADLQRQIADLRTATPANSIRVDAYNGRTEDIASLSADGNYLHTGSIAVPAGYSRAIVHSVISVGATNGSTTSDGYVRGFAAIQVPGETAGFGGDTVVSPVEAGGEGGTVTVSFTRTLSGLTASQILVAAFCSVVPSPELWSGGNGHISALAVFLR